MFCCITKTKFKTQNSNNRKTQTKTQNKQNTQTNHKPTTTQQNKNTQNTKSINTSPLPHLFSMFGICVVVFCLCLVFVLCFCICCFCVLVCCFKAVLVFLILFSDVWLLGLFGFWTLLISNGLAYSFFDFDFDKWGVKT